MSFLAAPLFGEKHFIGLVFVLLLYLTVGGFLNKRNLSNKKILLGFMIVFYVLEIIKLTYITIEDGSFPIYQLPFHMCSIPLYLYPLMMFLKPGLVVERFIKPAAYTIVLLAGVMALAMPTTIIGNDINWFPLSENILPILSFIYHGFMIFTSIYLLKAHIYNFMISDYKNVVIIAIIFALMAITMNNLLDKDFMMLNRGTGSPFQFLIEISKPLYISTMVGLALILIGLDFVITDAIVNPRRVSDKVKAH